MTAQVTLNGDTITVDQTTTIGDLVARATNRGDRPASDRGVAVAVNRSVVPRGDWNATTVASGDTIEIITAVQGG